MLCSKCQTSVKAQPRTQSRRRAASNRFHEKSAQTQRYDAENAKKQRKIKYKKQFKLKSGLVHVVDNGNGCNFDTNPLRLPTTEDQFNELEDLLLQSSGKIPPLERSDTFSEKFMNYHRVAEGESAAMENLNCHMGLGPDSKGARHAYEDWASLRNQLNNIDPDKYDY